MRSCASSTRRCARCSTIRTIRKRLEELGLEIAPPDQRSPEYLAKFLPEDIERWGKVITTAGISVD